MTTFYTYTFKTSSFRFLLVALCCCSFHFVQAQCNPDTTPPIAVCNSTINVALDGNGMAVLTPAQFDEGSFDNCCDVALQVRREGSTCPGFIGDATFGDDITLCCEDIAGSPIFVVLEVSDCNGNTNTCFTEVMVEDKLPPVALCPNDTIITCGLWTEFLEPAYTNSTLEEFNTVVDQYIGAVTYFDNCGTVDVVFSNFIAPNNQCEDFSFTREYTVTDGNPDNSFAMCSHTVTVDYSDFWDVVFPADTTVDDFGVSAPDFTGFPSFVSGSCGVLAFNYQDEVFTNSPGNCAKILRTWTVLNWCDASTMTQVQVLNISGGTPPEISCTDDLVVYATGTTEVVVPLPTTAGNITNYIVNASSDLPNFNANTYTATDVPLGNYTATFEVISVCGDTATCTTAIEVTDLGSPDCPQDTTINCAFYNNSLDSILALLAGDSQAQNESLNPFFGAPSISNGANVVSNVTLDVDACGQGTLTRVWEIEDGSGSGSDCFKVVTPSDIVATSDQVCMPITVSGFDNILSFQYSMNFDETVLEFANIIDPENVPDLNFGTSDIENGNLSINWFDDEVIGTSFPDNTLMYEICFNVIGNFGDASPFEFSSNPTVTEIVDGNEELVCFLAFNGNIQVGNGIEPLVVNPPTVLCTQIITIETTSDWSVNFPADTTVSCTFGSLEAGEPEIIDGGCGLFGVAYEDVVFTEPTYYVERTWTVINWCDETAQTYVQTIQVNDTNEPIFADNCNIPPVCLDNGNFSCTGGLIIPTPTVLDCGNIDLTATSDFGDGFGPFTNVEPGFYQVTFNASDDNGNTSVCVANVNVTDCTLPVAVCDVNVVVSLTDDGNGGGTAAIFAETLDDGSYDNCTSTANLSLSFSLGTDLNTINFDCSNVGNNLIELFVTDEYGNQNSCFTEVEVADILEVCPCSGLSNPPSLACNDNVQVSLDANGMAAFEFDYILEGISADCIADLDLSFSSTEDINVLNLDCSDFGTQTVAVYLTNNNGPNSQCWGTISVSDPTGFCGDITDCDNDVFVPNAICKDGLVVELMAINDPNNTSFEPMVEIWAIDLDLGSVDNCDTNLSFSFSSNTNDVSIIFNCDNIGENTVTLWVTDDAGNQSSCETFIVVQMNQGQCGGEPDCTNDDISPIAICNNNIIASLDFSGQVTIWASDIDDGSYDDCSTTVNLSFDAPGQEQSITLSCDNLGENVLTMYVTDQNSNQNACLTQLEIIDNLNACDNECLNDTEAPEAYCVNGLVIQLPSSGELTLSASLFNVGSIDNCTENLNLAISTVDNDENIISGPASGLPFNANNVGANNVVLTVTDDAGNQDECMTLLLLQSNPPKVITGKIFIDDNEDCEFNAGEQGLDTWSVKLEAIDDTLATEPGIVVLPPSFEIDAEGNYTITLPNDFVFFTLDSSTVSVNNLTPYLRVSLATAFNYGQNCDYNYFIDATTNVLDTVEIDFPVQIIEDCPQLSVDISTPYLRRCFDNTYYVNYCNFGNVAETDASIEIEFDAFLEINSSSLPWTSVDGNLYTFDIGTIEAAECGSFTLDFTVSCDAVLGQTHCTEAHIYPDVLCDPMSPQFSGASIDVVGQCDGNEVKFTITNVGNDDMDEALHYIVIEDFIMYQSESFQLPAGGTEEIVMPANGSTWRLETEQVAFHPGNSMPAVVVEGCSTDGTFTTGFVTQFYQNDNDPFVSINCQENIGSFDPNDKQATVVGYGVEHYIHQNTDIEYTIRFQNTGTDTAFNVVIMDTLDVNLDPLSVRPGASSHDYDFTILGDKVLKFNFDNIELPDSNVNVTASQGFVKFRVSQRPDVALETVIENNAAIYFDFNEPIITNVIFHTIGDDFIEIIDQTEEELATIGSIQVYPNPFDEQATVEIEGLSLQSGRFQVVDVQGRLVKVFDFSGSKFIINANELAAGMYFYQLQNEAGELLKNGKLVIK